MYIPVQFSYSADLQSVRNSYDQINQRFSGERYTKSSFSLEPKGTSEGIATIESVLNTSSIDGQQLATATKLHSINAKTGEYANQDTLEKSYMFAPRNLKKGQTFAFRHINYSVPARMHYSGEEKLFGLSVYRYEADFTQAALVPAGQPGSVAPGGQGLEYVPKLQMWVEPETGWLVKYNEDTTTYYYDAKSQQRLQPYEHFSHVFAESSIRQQAEYAQELKLQLSFARQTAPAILLTVIPLAIAAFFMRKTIRSVSMRAVTAVILAVSVTNIAGWLFHIKPLIALSPGNIGINPVISLCFMGLAVSLLFLYKQIHKTIILMIAASVAFISALQMASCTGFLPFNPGRLLFRFSWLGLDKNMESYTPIVVAFLLFVLSIGIVKTVLDAKILTIRFTRAAASIVVCAGMFMLFIRLLLPNYALSTASILSVPLAVSILLILAGYALFQIVQQRHGHATDIRDVLHALMRQCVVALPVLLLFVFAQTQQNSIVRQLEATFDARIAAIESAVSNDVKSYANMVAGAKALFAASKEVEREEWRQYIGALDLSYNFPGAQAVGFIKTLDKDQIGFFTDTVRRQGLANFEIFPLGQRAQYTAVLYVEPFDRVQRKTLGYDMSTDDVRNRAIERARDSGQPIISDKVNLLQETDENVLSGFLLFVPIYRNGLPSNTPEERQNAIEGYAYAAFDASVFLDKTLMGKTKNMHISVHDGLYADDTSLLYRNEAVDQTINGRAYATPILEKTHTMYVANHPWTFRYVAQSGLRLSSAQERMSGLIMTGGSTLYLLALLVFYMVVAPRNSKAIKVSQRKGNDKLS